jgi:transcriptional regulator with XRE-family HTH domain
MTPFGHKLRNLRQTRNVSLKEMAMHLNVSAAYLSALEHGKRGRPSWHLVQGVIAYLNIIWDEAEELVQLARLSHPKVTIDTAGLAPKATELANRLSRDVARLDDATLDMLLTALDRAAKGSGTQPDK